MGRKLALRELCDNGVGIDVAKLKIFRDGVLNTTEFFNDWELCHRAWKLLYEDCQRQYPQPRRPDSDWNYNFKIACEYWDTFLQKGKVQCFSGLGLERDG